MGKNHALPGYPRRTIFVPIEKRITPVTAELTVRETAALSGVSKTTVEKALEAGILRSATAPPRFRGGAMRYLPIRAVVYFRALDAAKLTDLSPRHKRAIWTHLARTEPLRLGTVEFAQATTIDLRRLAADSLRDAERYRRARDRYIVSDPAIQGGTSVVAGARLTVYAILGRMRDGETVDDLAADYPEVPREAFAAAELYARTHPLRGRPSGRPWRSAA